MGRYRAFVPPKMATSPILENLGRLRFAGGRAKTGSAHLDDLVLDHRSDPAQKTCDLLLYGERRHTPACSPTQSVPRSTIRDAGPISGG